MRMRMLIRMTRKTNKRQNCKYTLIIRKNVSQTNPVEVQLRIDVTITKAWNLCVFMT